MILRLSPQVLEDDLLHEALHQVPVFHNPMTDRPLCTKVQAFKPQNCGEMKKRNAGLGLCDAIRSVSKNKLSQINSKLAWFPGNGWIFQDVHIHQFLKETERVYKVGIAFPAVRCVLSHERSSYLSGVRGFVYSLVSDVEIQVIHPLHHPPLSLVSDLG